MEAIQKFKTTTTDYKQQEADKVKSRLFNHPQIGTITNLINLRTSSLKTTKCF